MSVTLLRWLAIAAILGYARPDFINMAQYKKIQANVTCGSPKEYYYRIQDADLSPRDRILRICDQQNPTNSFLPGNLVDGVLSTMWQSTRGRDDASIRIDLGLDVFVLRVSILFGDYRRPGQIAMLKSIQDDPVTRPWQYVVSAVDECTTVFQIATMDIRSVPDRVDRVTCVEYQQVNALDYGEEVTLDMNGQQRGDGSANWFAPDLYNWLTVSSLVLRFSGLYRQFDLINVEWHHYSVAEIRALGYFDCNGHGDANATGTWTSGAPSCTCLDNTCGSRCETCCPGYAQTLWKRGSGKPWTNDPSSACEACNCNGHSTRCVYNQTVANLRLSINWNGVYSGGGVCLGCEDNTDGINCDKCRAGYYRVPGRSITQKDACQACDCFPPGALLTDTQLYRCVSDELELRLYPNKLIGDCICKNNVGTRTCSSCLDGFFNLSASNPSGCQACLCSTAGTVGGSQICLKDASGQCSCKLYTTTRDCNMCLDGYYGLSASNRLGCTDCDCDRISSTSSVCDKLSGQCSCSRFFYTRNCNRVMPGYFIPDAYYIQDTSLTLALPRTACYRVVLVYLDNLRRPASTQFSLLKASEVVVGQSSSTSFLSCNGSICVTTGIELAKSQGSFCMSQGTWTVQVQSMSNGATLIRVVAIPLDFLDISNLGLYPRLINQSFISACNLLTNDMKFRQSQESLCFRGMTALTIYFYGQPIECGCNRIGSWNQTCDVFAGQCPCKPGITGRTCDRCSAGYYRFSTSGCLPCNCVGGNSISCDPTTGICNCPPNTVSPRCTHCECNSNSVTCQSDGVCTNCRYNSAGLYCERCLDGYYGDSKNQTCTPCDCDLQGSTSYRCDRVTGACSCRPAVTGRTCSTCMVNHYGLSTDGCRPCQCNPLGSLDQQCSPTGQCNCKGLASGPKCDVCIQGYFGLPNTECKLCKCNNTGTVDSTLCDSSGQCVCQPGVGGLFCDRCLDNYINFSPSGCQKCSVCTIVLQQNMADLLLTIESIKGMTVDLSKALHLGQNMADLSLQLSYRQVLGLTLLNNAQLGLITLADLENVSFPNLDRSIAAVMIKSQQITNRLVSLSMSLSTALEALSSLFTAAEKTHSTSTGLAYDSVLLMQMLTSQQQRGAIQLVQAYNAIKNGYMSTTLEAQQQPVIAFNTILDRFQGIVKTALDQIDSLEINLRSVQSSLSSFESSVKQTTLLLPLRVQQYHQTLAGLVSSKTDVLMYRSAVESSYQNTNTLISVLKADVGNVSAVPDQIELSTNDLDKQIQVLQRRVLSSKGSVNFLVGYVLTTRSVSFRITQLFGDNVGLATNPSQVSCLVVVLASEGGMLRQELGPMEVPFDQTFLFPVPIQKLGTSGVLLQCSYYGNYIGEAFISIPSSSSIFLNPVALSATLLPFEIAVWHLQLSRMTWISVLEWPNMLSQAMADFSTKVNILGQLVNKASSNVNMLLSESLAQLRLANSFQANYPDRFSVLIDSQRLNSTLLSLSTVLDGTESMVVQTQNLVKGLPLQTLQDRSEKVMLDLSAVVRQVAQQDNSGLAFSRDLLFLSRSEALRAVPNWTEISRSYQLLQTSTISLQDKVQQTQDGTESRLHTVTDQVSADLNQLSASTSMLAISSSDTSNKCADTNTEITKNSRDIGGLEKKVMTMSGFVDAIVRDILNLDSSSLLQSTKASSDRLQVKLNTIGTKIGRVTNLLSGTQLGVVLSPSSTLFYNLTTWGTMVRTQALFQVEVWFQASSSSASIFLLNSTSCQMEVTVVLESLGIAVVLSNGAAMQRLLVPLNIILPGWYMTVVTGLQGSLFVSVSDTSGRSRSTSVPMQSNLGAASCSSYDGLYIGNPSLASPSANLPSVAFDKLLVSGQPLNLWRPDGYSGDRAFTLPAQPKKSCQAGSSVSFSGVGQVQHRLVQTLTDALSISLQFRTFARNSILYSVNYRTTGEDVVLVYLENGRVSVSLFPLDSPSLLSSKRASYATGEWFKISLSITTTSITMEITSAGSGLVMDNTVLYWKRDLYCFTQSAVIVFGTSISFRLPYLGKIGVFSGDMRDLVIASLSTANPSVRPFNSKEWMLLDNNVDYTDVLLGQVIPGLRFYGNKPWLSSGSYASLPLTSSMPVNLTIIFKTSQLTGVFLILPYAGSVVDTPDMLPAFCLALMHGRWIASLLTVGSQMPVTSWMPDSYSPISVGTWQSISLVQSILGFNIFSNGIDVTPTLLPSSPWTLFAANRIAYIGGVPPGKSSTWPLPTVQSLAMDIQLIEMNGRSINLLEGSTLGVSSAGISPPADLPLAFLSCSTGPSSIPEQLPGSIGFNNMLPSTSPSLAMYSLDVDKKTFFKSSFVISLEFQAHLPNGVMLYLADSPTNPRQYISLEMVNGRLQYRFSDGQNNVMISTMRTVFLTSQNYKVYLLRLNFVVAILVPLAKEYYNFRLGMPDVNIDIGTPLYVGGVPVSVKTSSFSYPNQGFTGCINKIEVSSSLKVLNIDLPNPDQRSTNNLLVRCLQSSEPGYQFMSNSWFIFDYNFVMGPEFKMSLSFRTQQQDGLVFFLPTQDVGGSAMDVALFFERGVVYFGVSSRSVGTRQMASWQELPGKTDAGSYYVCNNNWHDLSVTVAGRTVTITLDGISRVGVVPSLTLLAGPLYIGGSKERIPGLPRGLQGCLRNVAVNGVEASPLTASAAENLLPSCSL